MSSSTEMIKQYLRFGMISGKTCFILDRYGDELAELQAYSGALYTMAFEKYFLGKGADKKTAAIHFEKIRDIADRFPDKVVVSHEIAECGLDLAYIVSEDDFGVTYSLRLKRDIQAVTDNKRNTGGEPVPDQKESYR